MVKGISHWLSRLNGKGEAPAPHVPDMTLFSLNPGDKVLVRSKDQIQATLDSRNELKGCGSPLCKDDYGRVVK